MFGSVSGKRVDEFAKELARQFVERRPPAEPRRRITPRELSAAVDDICRKAVAFNDEHKLGVYKKARLGNTFRWELAELGCPRELTDEITQRIVLILAAK